MNVDQKRVVMFEIRAAGFEGTKVERSDRSRERSSERLFIRVLSK